MTLGGGVQKCIYMLSKHFIKDKDHSIYIASSGGEYIDELEELGVKHIKIFNPENKNPIKTLKNIWEIYRTVKENSIDIIHSHHRMTTLYAKIVSKISRVKVVHSAHLYTEDKVKLTNLTLKNIPVISVSNGVREGLIEVYGIKKDSITTIYNTVEFNQTSKTVYGKIIEERDKGNFIVASVSRLEPVKGLDLLLKTALMLKEYKDIKFFLIGDGSLKEQFQEYIVNNHLEDNVLLLGKVPNIKDYLKYIDVVVQCSYREGFGLSVAEAASVGVPSIATDIHGLNEVIIDNYNGILIPTGSEEKIADAILKLYNDKTLLKRLGENGVKHFNSNFTKNKHYDGHLNFYKNLIN